MESVFSDEPLSASNMNVMTSGCFFLAVILQRHFTEGLAFSLA